MEFFLVRGFLFLDFGLVFGRGCFLLLLFVCLGFLVFLFLLFCFSFFVVVVVGCFFCSCCLFVGFF